jgi:hypothetical protein
VQILRTKKTRDMANFSTAIQRRGPSLQPVDETIDIEIHQSMPGINRDSGVAFSVLSVVILGTPGLCVEGV